MRMTSFLGGVVVGAVAMRYLLKNEVSLGQVIDSVSEVKSTVEGLVDQVKSTVDSAVSTVRDAVSGDDDDADAGASKAGKHAGMAKPKSSL